jgi:DNA-binding response OmpR family regulator
MLAKAAVATVLIVEDDSELRRMYATALRFAGFDVWQAGDGTRALEVIENHPPDLVILDLMLPTLDGIAVFGELVARHPGIRTMIVTGSNRDLSDVDADCVFRKPLSPERLTQAVRDCLEGSTRD